MVFKAVIAIGLWGGAAVGFLRGPLSWPERVLAMGAAGLLVAAVPLTDEIGFALSAAFLVWHIYRTRGTRAGAAA